ncbi:hypothetical protein [Bdellovibrio sp. HCB2-146]|uniref:hypothetical protein n=1 Tax=Bdellovibrio sp. HCB2-146 TaxID=3394362 RepID=UPI0039BCDA09
MRSSTLILVLAAAVGAITWIETSRKKKGPSKIKSKPHKYSEEEVDESLDESFPASDAPAWSSNTGSGGMPH